MTSVIRATWPRQSVVPMTKEERRVWCECMRALQEEDIYIYIHIYIYQDDISDESHVAKAVGSAWDQS